MNFENEEQREKYLRDLERLRRIQEKSRKSQSSHLDIPLNDNSGYSDRSGVAVPLDSNSGYSEYAYNDIDNPYGSNDSVRDSASRARNRRYQKADSEQINADESYLKPEKGRHARKKKKHTVRNVFIVLLLLVAAYIVKVLFFPAATGQKGYYTVAIFGVDSRDGNLDKDSLSDVNMLMCLNKETGEIKLVSIYRDTYVQIDEKGTFHKFNEAHFKGGNKQAVWCVENNLDVKVDDYATFNWKAVADVINIVGGVDIEITEPEFQYINSFITETVQSTGIGSVQLDHAGMNHLDGVQAVSYCRLRLMDTDYNRTERQRRVLGIVFDKIKSTDFNTKMKIFGAISAEISTSVGVEDVTPIFKVMDNITISDTAGFPFDKAGMNVGKKDCVIAVTLESNDIALHQFLYPDIPYTPSANMKKISNKIIKETGLGGSGEDTTVSTDKKDNTPIGPQTTKPVSETAPEVPIDATTSEETQTEEESTKAQETQTVEPSTETVKEKESSEEIGPGVTSKEESVETKETTAEIGPGIESTAKQSSQTAEKTTTVSESPTVEETKKAEKTEAALETPEVSTEEIGPGVN